MAVTVESIGSASSNTSGTGINLNAPAGVAVGDLLLAHCLGDTSWDTPSGWAQIQAATSGRSLAAFYKIAEAGDVGAGTFAFSTTGSGAKGGRVYRISGHDTASPIGASSVGTQANSTTVSTAAITPAAASSLIMILVGASSGGAARTCSGYTLATSSPTFTEHYEDQWDGNNNFISAASGIRSAATSTGTASATLDGTDPNVGIVLAITPLTTNASITMPVATIAITAPNFSLSVSASVSVGVLSVAVTTLAPAIAVTNNPWSTVSKSSDGTWTTTSKS